MLRLRYPRVWLAAGWGLVAAVCGGSLLPATTVGAVGTIHDKLLHAGSYLVLMLWFAGLYPRRRHGMIAALLLGLGVVLELLQGTVTSRQAEAMDVVANAAGLLTGLALSMFLLEGWCRRVEQRLLA